jgi:hypothetical protein
MDVRGISISDLANLGNLSFPNSFPIDNLNRALDTYVVEDKGEIISLGQLNPTIELILMQDKRRSKRERVQAFRKLMLEGMFLAKRAGYPQLEAFVEDDFALVLKRHYGFQDIKGKGIVLAL